MTAAGPFVVEARELVKRYGDDTVVDRVDLRVPRGGCFGLLGPNGAGKTTTLRMILGHSPPSGGTLDVLGESMPAAGRRVRERIGVVSQDDNLDPDFTVMENLEVYASYFPRRRGARCGRFSNRSSSSSPSRTGPTTGSRPSRAECAGAS